MSIFISYEKIKEFRVPSLVHSASLHPSRSVFVCGGEDFKMYKMDYTTGQELESFKGNLNSNSNQIKKDSSIHVSLFN